MFITIITDACCQNAQGRQSTRIANLFGCTPTFIGVDSSEVGVKSDIAAAGNLIDILDVAEDKEGYVLVNVAPRGHNKKWENGTPFGYFKYKNITIVSSIDGFTLSLVKKLSLTDKINLFDISEVTNYLVSESILSQEKAEFIQNTQFRSLEFLPKSAYWLESSYKLPVLDYSINEIPDLEPSVWWVDNFGNCKTSVFPHELEQLRSKMDARFSDLPFFERFTDVPKGVTAFIKGSSGLENSRFLEIITQKGSAAKLFNLEAGSSLMNQESIT